MDNNSQLEHLQSFFPKKITNINEINNFKTINFAYKNIYTFISSNSNIEGNFFSLNLFSLDSELNNNKNIIINLDSNYDMLNYYRGLYQVDIFNTEIENLYISNKIINSKEELLNYIDFLNKSNLFDNIIILMNFENNFFDIFHISNFNFLITDIKSKSIIKLDKILNVLSEYKKINFGIFFIDIDTKMDNLNEHIKFITNNFLSIHNNLFLIGIVFTHPALETAKKRKLIAFKNFNFINESYIFHEFKEIFYNYISYIKEKKNWAQKQKIKIM